MIRIAGFFMLGFVFLAPHTAHALEILVGLPYGKYRIGHSAVRIKTCDEHQEVIYDFGRYGKTWGYLRFQGEGIMRVWRGPDQVARYFEKQQSYRETFGFSLAVSEEEEKAIYQYYEALLETALWKKQFPLHARYRLAHDFDGVKRQCTGMALAGLEHVWQAKKYTTLLKPKFNKALGLSVKQKRYFFAGQRKQRTNTPAVPLDVIVSFRHALKEKHSAIKRVTAYPKMLRLTMQGKEKEIGSKKGQ